ncbi:hypothetical protein ZWY2020_020705 [Hordeum vulgare]|nr:hypothetical protein ZWY2020_020705 [Hordeum vulgare]
MMLNLPFSGRARVAPCPLPSGLSWSRLARRRGSFRWSWKWSDMDGRAWAATRFLLNLLEQLWWALGSMIHVWRNPCFDEADKSDTRATILGWI